MNSGKTAFALVGLMILAGVFGIAHAAGDAEAGKYKVAVCQACHGLDGNGPANPMWERYTDQDYRNMAREPVKYKVNPVWPKLAGQNETYLVRQLSHYRSGARKDPIMSGMAAGLSTADIEDIAAYYASQKLVPEPVSTDPAAKLGEELFKKGKPGMKPCMECHRSSGHGNEKVASIAGQHVAYVRRQLWAFKLEARKTAKEMAVAASKLNAAEIWALAQYLTGLE